MHFLILTGLNVPPPDFMRQSARKKIKLSKYDNSDENDDSWKPGGNRGMLKKICFVLTWLCVIINPGICPTNFVLLPPTSCLLLRFKSNQEKQAFFLYKVGEIDNFFRVLHTLTNFLSSWKNAIFEISITATISVLRYNGNRADGHTHNQLNGKQADSEGSNLSE